MTIYEPCPSCGTLNWALHDNAMHKMADRIAALEAKMNDKGETARACKDWCGGPVPGHAWSGHFSDDLKRAFCTTNCYLRDAAERLTPPTFEQLVERVGPLPSGQLATAERQKDRCGIRISGTEWCVLDVNHNGQHEPAPAQVQPSGVAAGGALSDHCDTCGGGRWGPWSACHVAGDERIAALEARLRKAKRKAKRAEQKLAAAERERDAAVKAERERCLAWFDGGGDPTFVYAAIRDGKEAP